MKAFLRDLSLRAVVVAAMSPDAVAIGPQGETAASEPTDQALPDVAYNAFHTSEIRQATLLKSMIYEQIPLGHKQKAAIDRIFAEFICNTIEEKPRAILLAYRAAPLQTRSGVIEKPEGDDIREFEEGAIDRSRPMLVDLVIDELDPAQMGQLRIVIMRWDRVRPPPFEGPVERLNRALNDPQIPLRSPKRQELRQAVSDYFKALPRSESSRDNAPKHEPEIRKMILASMDKTQGQQLEATLAMLEENLAEWLQPRHTLYVYADALKTLGRTWKTAKSD